MNRRFVTMTALCVIACTSAPLLGAPEKVKTVAEYFDKDKLAARFNAEAAKDVSHTFRIEITEVGTWSIAIDKGTLKVAEGRGDEPKTVIQAHAEIWLSIANGETTYMAPFMQGKLKTTDIGGVPAYFKYFQSAAK